MDLLPVAFEAPITTRALRLRFTASFDEARTFFRWKGQSRDGKRVALGEWMALQPLDTAALDTALLPVDKTLEMGTAAAKALDAVQKALPPGTLGA